MKNVAGMQGAGCKEKLSLNHLEINMGLGFRSTSGMIHHHLMQDDPPGL